MTPGSTPPVQAAAPSPAVVDGKHRLKTLEIQPEVVDPEDTEMLADLVIAAVNEAVRQAAETSEAEMSKVTGGMNLPGMF